MNREKFKKQLFNEGFTKDEINAYFRKKDNAEKKKQEEKKLQKKLDKKRKPIIFYGYNTTK